MEYRLARIICKHFRLSIIELDTDIEYGEYFCLLAEALDAEELEAYENYILAGGDKKKWKWSSPDEAGTSFFKNPQERIKESIMEFGQKVLRLDLTHMKKGKAREFAKFTGRPILLMNPDMVLFDESGELYNNKDYDPSTIIVRIDYEGNELN